MIQFACDQSPDGRASGVVTGRVGPVAVICGMGLDSGYWFTRSPNGSIRFSSREDAEIRAAWDAAMDADVKIVHNKLLGGWYVVRGPHQTPIGGRYESKKAAQASLDRRGQDSEERELHLETDPKTGEKFPHAKKSGEKEMLVGKRTGKDAESTKGMGGWDPGDFVGVKLPTDPKEAERKRMAARTGNTGGARGGNDAEVTTESIRKAGARIARTGSPSTSQSVLSEYIKNLPRDQQDAARAGYEVEIRKAGSGRLGEDTALDSAWDVALQEPDQISYKGYYITKGPDDAYYVTRDGHRVTACKDQQAAREFVDGVVSDDKDGLTTVIKGTPERGIKIPPPKDPKERADWEARVKKREAAGGGKFVGDY